MQVDFEENSKRRRNGIAIDGTQTKVSCFTYSITLTSADEPQF
jgi:hypothetical protein